LTLIVACPIPLPSQKNFMFSVLVKFLVVAV